VYRKESYDTLSRRHPTEGDLRGDLGDSCCDSFQDCTAVVITFAQQIIMSFSSGVSRKHPKARRVCRGPVGYTTCDQRETRKKSPEEKRRECELLVKRL
jgi:hypothetical protein